MNPLRRNELAAATLLNRLSQAQIGVVAQGLTDIDIVRIASLIAKNLSPLYVASVGYPIKGTIPQAVTIETEIEKAVGWRHTSSMAGRLLVFVQGEAEKLHSLHELDILSPRDLSRFLLEWANTNLSDNEPQRRFWKALLGETAMLPLVKIEDFVRAVQAEKDNPEAISGNLWRLGLLQDESLLNSNQDQPERLHRNRALIVEMLQLSDSSRRRMSTTLA